MNHFRVLAVLACAVLSVCRTPAAGEVAGTARSLDADAPHRTRLGAWADVRYGRTGDFRPTAVTQLPDGDLLVLERRFELFVLAPPLLVDDNFNPLQATLLMTVLLP